MYVHDDHYIYSVIASEYTKLNSMICSVSLYGPPVVQAMH